jgi:hypothetical protein
VPADAGAAEARTRAWVEHAVIGLGLCPFARAPQRQGRVRYAISAADAPQALLDELLEELGRLVTTPAEELETTLLVIPRMLADFDEFQDFTAAAESALQALGLEGVVQLASFHPDFRFEGTAADDVTNATNRSPFPTLHLLREESIERAVDAHGDPDRIVEANLATLRALGPGGWAALQKAWRDGAAGGVDAGSTG